MLGLIILGVVVLAGVVAYKLWKSGKAVTGTAVVAGVEAEAKTLAGEAANTVASTVVTDIKTKL